MEASILDISLPPVDLACFGLTLRPLMLARGLFMEPSSRTQMVAGPVGPDTFSVLKLVSKSWVRASEVPQQRFRGRSYTGLRCVYEKVDTPNLGAGGF